MQCFFYPFCKLLRIQYCFFHANICNSNQQANIRCPILGYSPLCLRISISSPAFLMALKAASISAFGSPAIVTTIQLVALPASIFNNLTPATVSISAIIWLMIVRSDSSLKLGTHSISCYMSIFF